MHDYKCPELINHTHKNKQMHKQYCKDAERSDRDLIDQLHITRFKKNLDF